MAGATNDVYAGLVTSSAGRRLASGLGLPVPTALRRYEPGQPLLAGPALVAGLAEAPVAAWVTADLRRRSVVVGGTLAELDEVAAGERLAAVVLDLTAATEPADLELFPRVLGPALKRLGPSARVVVVGRTPAGATSPAQAAARRALEGVVRSVGKELRRGATANLVLLEEGAEASQAAGALTFLLSARSAFVDGQVVVVRAGDVDAPADTQPLKGKVAVVTGAARGIGASVVEVLARDGATVICVDVPSAGAELAKTANRVGGTALQLDVTNPAGGGRILEHATHRHGGLDIVVHNAGITRDKLLANMDEQRWDSVIDVNLEAILTMNEALLAPGGLRDGGHVVLVASIAGIAGNRGQTNYAASKAGVIGLVGAYAADADLRTRRITTNAVAPGFIETEMTAKIPLGTRELGRRLSSLQQGGLPVDVAETISWYAQDGGVSGNVVRVCGQSILGA